MSEWKPIETFKFPWRPDKLLVAAYHKDDRELAVFVCVSADGGNLYPGDSRMALDEVGWIAYAWSPDIPPDLPPMSEEK